MKEIKIIFNNKDINVQAEEMSGREFLTALGTAFIAGCEKFNVEPLSAIETIMDAEDAVEDGEYDEDDESLWYDDSDECDNCGRPYVGCNCDDDVFLGRRRRRGGRMISGKFKVGDVILNRRWGVLWEVVKVHPFHYIMKNLENDVIATFPILPVDGASRKLTEDERNYYNV